MFASTVSIMHFKGSGPDSIRQEKPHLHSVRYSPDGQYLFASDLGSDKLYRFIVNDTPFEGQPGLLENSLKEFGVPAGTGPRHFDFHPDGGRFLYLLGELSGEVIVYDYSFGELIQKQVIAADTTGAVPISLFHPTGVSSMHQTDYRQMELPSLPLILAKGHSPKPDIN